jgi:hypothetical protein
MYQYLLKRLIPAAVLILLFALLVSTNAQVPAGITYYVATNGADTNVGTEAQPFKTLVKGVSVLKPGDMLLVKEGLYEEELRGNIPSGESWSRPVTLRAYPGHRVIIQPKAGAGAFRVIGFTGSQHHIIVDGFILDGTNVQYETIKISGNSDRTVPSPTYIRIMNNEIRNAGAATNSNGQYRYFSAGILTTGEANYIEYIHNVIHNNGVTDFDHGIYHTSSYSLIEGNVIYGNMGSGIKVGWGQNAVDNVVRNNIIFDNNAAQGADGKKKQGRGIGVYAGSGTLIYNNVIWGAHFIGIDVTYGGNNARVYNNTVLNNTGYGIAIGFGSDGSDTAANTTVKNNIVFQQSNFPAIFDSRGINTVVENNLTFGMNPDIDADAKTNTIMRNNFENVDPKFLDVTSRNFALQSSSPAIDKGIVIGEVPFDIANTQRPQGTGYDIGAYEFRGQVSPTQPPQSTAIPSTPIPSTPIPPTPVVYTNPTIYLSVQSAAVQTGDTVSVDVNVANGADLFALQLNCTTNPQILNGLAGSGGSIFTSSNSLFANQAYNTTDGSWVVAASRMRPETGFTGNGVALTMNYRLLSLVTSPITCTAIVLDSSGHQLPFEVVGTSFTPAASSEGTVVVPTLVPTDMGELPGPETEPLPTEVPTLEPTIAPVEVTPTLPPPSPSPIANTATVSGTVAYQIRLESLGINVQLLANDQLVAETVADAEGNYSFNNVAPGQYIVKASGSGHLPVARPITVDAAGQPFVLDRLTLVAGDIDDSAAIDLGDAGLIGANFGLEGSLFPPADLNTDNQINILDLVVIGANFGLSGLITVP